MDAWTPRERGMHTHPPTHQWIIFDEDTRAATIVNQANTHCMLTGCCICHKLNLVEFPFYIFLSVCHEQLIREFGWFALACMQVHKL